MRKKPRLAILAARPGDSEFWQLEPLVKKCGVMVMTILSEFLLFEVLPRESLRLQRTLTKWNARCGARASSIL
jgi:hypothetical protein